MRKVKKDNSLVHESAVDKKQKIIAPYLGMSAEFYSKLKKKIASQEKLKFQ